MNEQPSTIAEGGDAWGSRLAPPNTLCECTVQSPVQTTAPGAGGDVNTVSLVGIGGGAGCTTTAALLALAGRAMVPTELATADRGEAAALLGVNTFEDHTGEALPLLRIVEAPTGDAELTIVDTGTLDGALPGRTAGELRLGVLRGPCYMALRTLLANPASSLDGLVLVVEPGRALGARDVTDATGLEVAFAVPASPAIARAIDAGLLATRSPSMRALRPLTDWLAGLIEPFPARLAPPHPTAPPQPEMTDTDLLVALCATSEALGAPVPASFFFGVSRSLGGASALGR